MKRIFLIFTACLLLVPAAIHSQVKIAIFDPVGEVSDAIKTVVREEVSSVVVSNPNFAVLERANIDKVLEENKFQGKYASESEMSELGRMMGANYICLITIVYSNSQYYIFCKQVDVNNAVVENQGEGKTAQTGEIMFAAKQSARFFRTSSGEEPEEQTGDGQPAEQTGNGEIAEQTGNGQTSVPQPQPEWNMTPQKPPKPPKTSSRGSRGFLMAGASVGSATSYSLMLGYMPGAAGGYVRAKSGSTLKDDAQTIGENEAYFVDDFVETGHYAVSAGMAVKLFASLTLYAGVGYGEKWVKWKTLSEQLYFIDERSFSGLEPEAGFIISIRKFAISAGISVLTGKTESPALDISIGFTF